MAGSVMDILKLKKKAVVVPTPGQGEQVYLAKFLSGKNYVISFRQKRFSLKNIEKHLDGFNFKWPVTDMELYKRVVKGEMKKFIS